MNTTQPLWRTEFDKQYTKEMLCLLVKRATALIKRYDRFKSRKNTDTAEDRITRRSSSCSTAHAMGSLTC